MRQYGGNEYIIMQLLNQNGIEAELIYRQRDHFQNIVRENIDAGKPVILGLNRGEGGHFVVAYGISGENYLIMDPEAGQSTIAIASDEIASAVYIINA